MKDGLVTFTEDLCREEGVKEITFLPPPPAVLVSLPARVHILTVAVNNTKGAVPFAESERDHAWAEGRVPRAAEKNVLRYVAENNLVLGMSFNRCVASFTLHPSRCSTLEHGGTPFSEGLRERMARQAMSWCCGTFRC